MPHVRVAHRPATVAHIHAVKETQVSGHTEHSADQPIAFLTNLFGSVVFWQSIAAVAAIVAVWIAVLRRRDSLSGARAAAFVDLARDFETAERRQLLADFQAANGAMGDQQLINLFDTYNSATRQRILQIVYLWDRAGHLLRNGHIDGTAFIDQFGGGCVHTWDHLKPVILHARERDRGFMRSFEYLAERARAYATKHRAPIRR